MPSLVRAGRQDPGAFCVISTKAEGRAEKSGPEWALRQIRDQMSRLRCASLDMTDDARLSPNRGEGPMKAPGSSAILSLDLPSGAGEKKFEKILIFPLGAFYKCSKMTSTIVEG